MEIEVFCVCDGAYNYNGKLTIVGTFDQLVYSSVPIIAKISIALKLNVLPSEFVENSKVVLSFKGPDGNPVAKDIVNYIPSIPLDVNVIHLAMAISVDMNVSSFGVHHIELYLNDKPIRTKELPIVRKS